MAIRRSALLLLCLAAVALPARADRLLEYDKLRQQGRVDEGLALLRAELASPPFFAAPGRGVYLRQRLLIALGEHANLHGVTPERDAEARKHYEEGLARHAGGDPILQAVMHNGMVIYYSRTSRNGMALPMGRKVLEQREKGNDYFELFLAQDFMVNAYLDQGEFEIAMAYMDRVLKTIDTRFVVGRYPAEHNKWAELDKQLAAYMDYAGQAERRDLMERVWAKRVAVAAAYFPRISSESRFQAASVFALVGDRARAAQLYQEGEQMWAGELPFWQAERSVGSRVIQVMGRVRACAAADVAFFTEEYAKAAEGYGHCMALARAEGSSVNQMGLQRQRGLALEGAGRAAEAAADLRASIEQAEKTRASFTVGERARVFRTSMRGSYWGLARIQARAASDGGPGFFEALSTSEQIRGRQLGELVDPQVAARISPASLAALQAGLPQDLAVLAYTVTPKEVIFYGLTREQRLAVVTPLDGSRFSALARGIAADLAKPGTAQADRSLAVAQVERAATDLERRLLEMSEPLLAAARPLLAGKSRIVALPDGVMNLVPFELLSASAGRYEPLLEKFVVSAAPSLLFLQRAGAARAAAPAKLFALADPIYARPSELAGVPVAELQATRGSRFLSYFQPLPETRTEALAISAMFKDEALVLAGESALESRVKAAGLGNYRYLHFATHGILGGEVPGVNEPALVLGDEPGEDGFLTATEVARLKLDADLAVLSACNTGSGELVTGEGVMGISRAFLAAGSRSVVVSLWPVASKATERLMIDFYRRLRAGEEVGQALRSAKLDFLRKAREEGSAEIHPFFWAPFIVLGG